MSQAASAADEAAPEPRAGKTWRIWGVDFDARMVQTITAAMLVLLVAYDNNFGQPEYGHLVLEALVPLAVIVLVWREDPRRYGMVLGDWRLGLPVAVAGIAIMSVAIWFLGQLPDFRVYYTLLAAQRPAWRVVLDTGVDMFAWEFFFRGWLLGSFGPQVRHGRDLAADDPVRADARLEAGDGGPVDDRGRRLLRHPGLAHSIVRLGLAAPLVHDRRDHPGCRRLHLSGVARAERRGAGGICACMTIHRTVYSCDHDRHPTNA